MRRLRNAVMLGTVLAGILAGQAFGHTPEGDGRGLTAGQVASAQWYAEAALAATTTEPQAFRDCIRAGEPVFLPRVFVGYQCDAFDGERWYAGLVFVNDGEGERALLSTGP